MKREGRVAKYGVPLGICASISSSPSLQNKDPVGGVGSTSRRWRWV